MQSTKRAFLREYAKQPITIRQAAEKVGYNFATIWRWRQVDPEFDQRVAALRDTVEPSRVFLVEEALFVRCASAKASPVETIFYLQNMAGHKWSDRRRLEHTGKEGGAIETRATQVITFGGEEVEIPGRW